MVKTVLQVAVATRDLNPAAFPPDFEFKTDPEPNFPLVDLDFIAGIAVSDPPRVGALEAVMALRNAGVIVMMVTGDAPATAVAVAESVGIVSKRRKPPVQFPYPFPGTR